jgi:hypothetical protein
MEVRIPNALENVTAELFELLNSFQEDQINLVPFEGSWTAAQVADHLYRSDSSVIDSLYGETTFTLRNPDEKIAQLKEVFLNFEVKLKSPEIVLPSLTTFDRENVINKLKSSRQKLVQASTTLNLSETSQHPALGELTRLEFFAFVIYHTQRHIHQLENIYHHVHTVVQ